MLSGFSPLARIFRAHTLLVHVAFVAIIVIGQQLKKIPKITPLEFAMQIEHEQTVFSILSFCLGVLGVLLLSVFIYQIMFSIQIGL